MSQLEVIDEIRPHLSSLFSQFSSELHELIYSYLVPDLSLFREFLQGNYEPLYQKVKNRTLGELVGAIATNPQADANRKIKDIIDIYPDSKLTLLGGFILKDFDLTIESESDRLNACSPPFTSLSDLQQDDYYQNTQITARLRFEHLILERKSKGLQSCDLPTDLISFKDQKLVPSSLITNPCQLDYIALLNPHLCSDLTRLVDSYLHYRLDPMFIPNLKWNYTHNIEQLDDFLHSLGYIDLEAREKLRLLELEWKHERETNGIHCELTELKHANRRKTLVPKYLYNLYTDKEVIFIMQYPDKIHMRKIKERIVFDGKKEIKKPLTYTYKPGVFYESTYSKLIDIKITEDINRVYLILKLEPRKM